MRHDSDVDLLLDFPDDRATSLAWGAAEEACRELGLRPDIRSVTQCSPAFLAHVVPDAEVLA